MKYLISLGLFLTIETFSGLSVSGMSSSINNKDFTIATSTLKSEPAINLPPTTPSPAVVAMEDSNDFGLDNSTNHPQITQEDIQRTQMIAVVGFSALVIMAIFAWLFSRHYCCFIEKATSHPSRQNPSQFNFLGAPVRVIRRLSNSTLPPPKREDPPPSYDELFPTSPASSTPAPAYTAVDMGNVIQPSANATVEESKDPEVTPSSLPA